ncbi:MAG: lysophospholipid acyltransferase family protein [Candidatus Kapabacteria bacterium]|nr:lysophospholipid acyltransferase family protein [Candidatus Kapabacteria bacterium]
MKTLHYRFVVALLRGIGVIAYRLTREKRTQYGCKAGEILHRIYPKRRQITLDNLRRAFPEREEEWIQATAHASYQNLGITLLELLILPHITPSEARAMISFRGTEEIEAEIAAGRGVVLISGHLSNWELLAFAFPLYTNIPTSLIVAPPSNKYVEEYLKWYRSRTGNRILPMHNVARTIVERLANCEAIAMLADQAASEHDALIPFFGTLAPTYEAPAALALKRNVALFGLYAVRDGEGLYTAEAQRIPHEDLLPDKEGILELTHRHVALLEEKIRQYPDLWAWQQRRWKSNKDKG